MTDPTLVRVHRVPDLEAIELTWSDGFTARPTYRFLCGYCPCAGCQGHTGQLDFHEPPAGVQPAEISAVGNYAVSIRWHGGCQDGIYSFALLRRLCETALTRDPGTEKPEAQPNDDPAPS